MTRGVFLLQEIVRAAGISPRGPGHIIEFGSLNDLLSFPLTDYPATLKQDSLGRSGSGCAKIDISWASRADSSGSEHPLEQENPSGHSDSDAGASIHTLL